MFACATLLIMFGSYDFRFYSFFIFNMSFDQGKTLVEQFSGVLQCVIKVDQKVLCFSLKKS